MLGISVDNSPLFHYKRCCTNLLELPNKTIILNVLFMENKEIVSVNPLSPLSPLLLRQGRILAGCSCHQSVKLCSSFSSINVELMSPVLLFFFSAIKKEVLVQ